MIDPETEDRLSQLLDELGPADPPRELVQQVMARISVEQHTVSKRSAQVRSFTRGGMVMTRKALLGLAAAAAVALAVYTFIGFPPIDQGTEGTIGAAQKYQVPQLASKDVVLGDASVQEFLQSELFDQLAKDPEARDLLTNASVKAALDDAEMRRAIADEDIRNALTNRAVHRLYDDAGMRAELESQVKTQMSAAAMKKAMGETDARGQARAAVARMLQDAGVRKAMQNDVVRRALDNGDLRRAMVDARMARALNRGAFVNAVTHRGFAAALRTNAIATELAKR